MEGWSHFAWLAASRCSSGVMPSVTDSTPSSVALAFCSSMKSSVDFSSEGGRKNFSAE